MDKQPRKTRKRSALDVQDADTQDVEDSPNGNSDNVIQNHRPQSDDVLTSPQSNDVLMTLKGIQKNIAEIMAMKQTPSSSDSHCKWPIIEHILRDIQESIEYLVTIKTDMEEMKIILGEMNSKISAIMEKQDSSVVDVHQILSSIPYGSLSGVEKLDQWFTISTIFAQMKEEFSRLGGQPEKMSVIVLNKLIAKNVQGQLTWNDSGTTIHLFKNVLRFIHAVGKANSVVYTEKDGNEALKAALKNARSKN